MEINTKIKKSLKKYFGFTEFKGLQEAVITNVVKGNNVFAIMPTGAGKSLCYQLPALILDGMTIIISPLIALMKNQVDSMRYISKNEGVAHVLNSSLLRKEIQQVKEDIENNVTKMLFMAPESLNKEEYIQMLSSCKISFLAIDEAHCISEWGHDFRPEYRNLNKILNRIGDNIPIVALTATATEKVQQDIIKNLQLKSVEVFKDSFNRPNLFYEVRAKTENVNSDIVRFIKNNSKKSGIIYCLSRKKVNKLAEFLVINGISALPYHAGLDAKMRSKHQDMFLMEDVDVIVATIAFGMGIDKSDVRFVIHYDFCKSLESYYQETGRAGRDGGEGHCLAFYDYKDIEKLKKFVKNKPLAEQEVSESLLDDVVAYAETAISRRKYLLYYFGESFDETNGKGALMDDNAKYPKEKIEAKNEVFKILDIIKKTSEKFKIKEIILILVGRTNAAIKSRQTDTESYFGIGNDKDDRFWMALIRQLIVAGYLKKYIEKFGLLFLTEKSKKFLKSPTSFMMIKDRVYDSTNDSIKKINESASIDETLLNMLKGLRKSIANKLKLPTHIIFEELSLEEMVLKLPTTLNELTNVVGIGVGKAKKYGTEFIKLIDRYIKENGLEKTENFVVKSANTFTKKLFIIQSIDRRFDLEEMVKVKNMTIDELLNEMERIVHSGTKLNIQYLVDNELDEECQEELYDYFIEQENVDIVEAYKNFDGEYEEEHLKLYKIKFYNDLAN